MAQETSLTSLGPFFRLVYLLPLVSRRLVIPPLFCFGLVLGCRSLTVLELYPFPTREQLLVALALGACVVFVVAVAAVMVFLVLWHCCTMNKT